MCECMWFPASEIVSVNDSALVWKWDCKFEYVSVSLLAWSCQCAFVSLSIWVLLKISNYQMNIKLSNECKYVSVGMWGWECAVWLCEGEYVSVCMYVKA